MKVKFNLIFALTFFVALASSAENSFENCPFNRIQCSCLDQGSGSGGVSTNNFPGVYLYSGKGLNPGLSNLGLCLNSGGASEANAGSGGIGISGIGYSGENLKYAGGLVGGSFSTNIGNTIYVHPSALASFIGTGGYNRNTGLFNCNQGGADLEKLKISMMLKAKLNHIDQQRQMITSLIEKCNVVSRPTIDLRDVFKTVSTATSNPSSESTPKSTEITSEPAKAPTNTDKDCKCVKCTAVS